jgi:hypothetical protein
MGRDGHSRPVNLNFLNKKMGEGSREHDVVTGDGNGRKWKVVSAASRARCADHKIPSRWCSAEARRLEQTADCYLLSVVDLDLAL